MKDAFFVFLIFWFCIIFCINLMGFIFVLDKGNEYCDNPTKVQYIVPAVSLACWSLEPIEKD